MAEHQNGSAAGGEGRQVLWIGGLLVLVIALLVVLWVRERTRRARAEASVAQLQERLAILQQLGGISLGPGALGGLSMGGGGVQPIRRDDLAGEEGQFLGRAATILRISAEAGTRLGFRPGDVVVVGERPQPPASRPSR